MARLNTKVKLYLEANSKTWDEEQNNIILQNDSDGKGDYIASWNVSGLKKPTNAQLSALDNNADITERNNRVIITRKKLYGSWDKQLEEINEQGLDAWKERIAQIKVDNPKES
tara:strand:- start:606 stop:944 length:339 start_codon:yes stop_codon:yes gene_type:complete